MIKVFVITAAVVLTSAPVLAQDLVFSMQATDSCLMAGTDSDMSCIGASAQMCMQQTVGGESTVGMGGCLDAERSQWDARLNDHYQQLMTKEKAEDAEMTEIGSSAPKQAPALKDMQRAWISYRDERCTFVAAQWGGGTGAGPAAIGCHMHVTAQQALFLQQMLEN